MTFDLCANTYTQTKMCIHKDIKWKRIKEGRRGKERTAEKKWEEALREEGMGRGKWNTTCFSLARTSKMQTKTPTEGAWAHIPHFVLVGV